MIRIRPALAILIVVLFAGPLLAQDIIVHANLPVGTVPAECREMTPKQFQAWAKAQNVKALATAEAKHQAYLEQRGPLKTANVIENSSSNTTQLGGLNGRSGVGGTGGLLSGFGVTGYSPSTGSNGYGRPNFFTGNTIKTSHTDSSRAYTMTYPDLNDAGGGPVEIINPFCYDFWMKHIEE